MFESISVSERTRKPWTVAVSFAAQCGALGVIILIPLLTHSVLPRGRLAGFLLPPLPKGSTPHRPQQPHVKQTLLQQTVYKMPSLIPQHVNRIVDPEILPPPSTEIGGVPFSPGSETSAGSSVIDGLAHIPSRPEPPPPPVVKEQPKPVTRRIVATSRLQAAKLISRPKPLYPPLAKSARISGAVRLRAVIARDGTIMELRAVSGHPLLIPAALAAVQQWVFQPTNLNGEPVEVATEIVVDFTLQQ